MSIFNTIAFINQHPLTKKSKYASLKRYLKWQFNGILNPYPVIYPFVNDTKILAYKGLTGATGNIYCGLHEFEDMGFLLHFLRPEDTFLDIGANVGSYSILASGVIGAKSVVVEPVPTTFALLKQNIAINNIESVLLRNMAIGSKQGTISFTSNLDTVNHVAIEGENEEMIEVEVTTLDQLCEKFIPRLIKIDVEGYETEVIKGGKNILYDQSLNAMIVELNNSGEKYGYDEQTVHNSIVDAGFQPFSYEPFSRSLTKLRTFGKHNTLYLRDVDFVQDRLKKAKKFKVLNQEI